MCIAITESGLIDDFEVKLDDSKVCISTCKLDKDQVTEILKKCVKEVKFLGKCDDHPSAMQTCSH